MKTHYFYPLLSVLLLAQASADSLIPGGQYSTDAVISPGSAGTDFWIYEEANPGNLVKTDNVGNVDDVLSGHAGAAGGNVELFPTSEWPVFADASVAGAFATVIPTTLSGTAGAASFSFRSLNGNDWFGTGSGYDTSFGAATLATEWFNGFIDSVAGLMSNPFAAAGLSAVRGDLFETWRDSGGFPSLSDANIGYVYGSETEDGTVHFGLEGFLDASPRFREMLTEAGHGGFVSFVPDGIQYSEAVVLNDEVYYSFNNATPSGVQLDDEPFNSYTGNFAFTSSVPEPSSMLCVSLTVGIASLRRRR